jgi:hypothetical protein
MALRATILRRLFFPWVGGTLASNDNRLRATLHSRFVTAFSFVGTITADAGNDLIDGNPIEEVRRYRRIADSVVGYFDSSDFRYGRVNAKANLAPLVTIAVLCFLVLPLILTYRLNAVAVDQAIGLLSAARRSYPKDASGSCQRYWSQDLPLQAASSGRLCLVQGKVQQTLDR